MTLDALTRLLLDMTYLLLIAGGCSIVLSRLKMPPIVGYLVAGIILGPTMLHDISVDPATITLLSNLGIVLLMFSIGLELNLNRLRQLGSFTFIVLLLEMPFMVITGYLAGLALGMSSVQAIFLGAVISGTSTAVIVSVLHARSNISKEDAETIISITVMEDIGQVIILTMAAPLLVGDTPALGSVALMIGGIVVFMAGSILLGIIAIPRVLNWISKNFAPEVLIIVSLGLCFAMALISNVIGLSIAIGAFLMGLIVSQAICSKEVLVRVGPMKEVFMAVFFISIGIQIVPVEILNNILLAVIIAAVFISAKFVGVASVSYLVGGKAQSSFMIGFGLVAMGEFAFIIAKTALDAGVVDQQFYASVIGAALITMVVLTVVSRHTTSIFNALSSRLPASVRETLEGFDGIRADVGRRASISPEAAGAVKRELILILVDVMAIVLIQVMFVVFNLFGDIVGPLSELLNVYPDLALALINGILMLPAVISMMQGVKRIANILAGTRTPGPSYVGGRRLYRRFRNLGELAAVIILILLLLPFIATYLGVYVSIWIVVISLGIAIAYTGWRIFRHAQSHIVCLSDDERRTG